MSGAARLEKCPWCWKRNCLASEWEQKHHRDGWQPLCKRCARTRLNNPWNALLGLRKVGDKTVS